MDKIKLGQWLLRNSTTFPPKPNHCELAMNANEANNTKIIHSNARL